MNCGPKTGSTDQSETTQKRGPAIGESLWVVSPSLRIIFLPGTSMVAMAAAKAGDHHGGGGLGRRLRRDGDCGGMAVSMAAFTSTNDATRLPPP